MKATDFLTHGVYLIGSSNGEMKNLMTAAWVAQVTGNTVMVAVGKRHYTADVIRNSGHFSVSVLGQEHRELAAFCGKNSGRNVDKTVGMALKESQNGDPILDSAIASFSCQVVHMVDDLDHAIFFGKIVDSDAVGGTPLQYKPAEW